MELSSKNYALISYHFLNKRGVNFVPKQLSVVPNKSNISKEYEAKINLIIKKIQAK